MEALPWRPAARGCPDRTRGLSWGWLRKGGRVGVLGLGLGAPGDLRVGPVAAGLTIWATAAAPAAGLFC